MFALLKSKYYYIGQLDDNVKISYIYRYISLIFISIFSLFFNGSLFLFSKLIITICMIVASIILNNLYILVKDNRHSIIFLILMETAGNIFILIPTGGLKSPYIWYAINTVLVTLIYLNMKYCIANLSIYILSSIFVRYMIDKSEEIGLKYLVLNYSNLILGLILTAIAFNFLLQTQNEVKKEKSNLISVNKELNSLNNRLNELIVQIVSLYQTVYTLSNESDKTRIIELLLSYVQGMIKSEFAFFCEVSDADSWDIRIKGISDINVKGHIMLCIKENLESISRSNNSQEYTIDGMKIIVKSISSSYSNYGIIGFGTDEPDLGNSDEKCFQLLSILATVGAMALERVDLEKENRRFLINEEQNRIADEIHDSVCQRLFAASCSIQAMLHNKKASYPQIIQELGDIHESLQNANKELRETIYGMSWKKNGTNAFCNDITNYIGEISRLYHKRIKLKMNGNQEILSHNIKNVLYRIICECAGNAMRHSQCSVVEINMDIKAKGTSLVISDNGEGFHINGDFKNGGLGISNLYSLVQLYNGQISIESASHKGTVINIHLPNYRPEREEAV